MPPAIDARCANGPTTSTRIPQQELWLGTPTKSDHHMGFACARHQNVAGIEGTRACRSVADALALRLVGHHGFQTPNWPPESCTTVTPGVESSQTGDVNGWLLPTVIVPEPPPST